MLMKKHLGVCWSQISEEEKLQCDFAQRSLDFETYLHRNKVKWKSDYSGHNS